MQLNQWLIEFSPQKIICPHDSLSELLRLEAMLKQSPRTYPKEELELKILWIKIKHSHYNSRETDTVMDHWKTFGGGFIDPLHAQLHLQMGIWGFYERGLFQKIQEMIETENQLQFTPIQLEPSKFFIERESWLEMTWSALWVTRSQIRPWVQGQAWSRWPIEWMIHLADPNSKTHPDFHQTKKNLIASTNEYDVNTLPDCIKSEWITLLME